MKMKRILFVFITLAFTFLTSYTYAGPDVVNGSNWSGNVPTNSSSVTDTSGAVTRNTSLVLVTSQSLTTAHDANSTITLTNSKIKTGNTVRVSLVAYSGTLGTNGIPLVSIGTINTSAHTCVINITNAGTSAALSGTVTVLVEVVSLP